MLKFEKRTVEKEHRYRSTLVFMLVVLDASNLAHVDLSGAEYESVEGMAKEEIQRFFYEKVEAHYIFSYLYASDDVLKKMKCFLDNPTKMTYRETATAMRKDLWT